MEKPINQDEEFKIYTNLDFTNSSISSYYFTIAMKTFEDFACLSYDLEKKPKNKKLINKLDYLHQRKEYALSMSHYYKLLSQQKE